MVSTLCLVSLELHGAEPQANATSDLIPHTPLLDT